MISALAQAYDVLRDMKYHEDAAKNQLYNSNQKELLKKNLVKSKDLQMVMCIKTLYIIIINLLSTYSYNF